MNDDLGEITASWTVTFRRSSKHPAARLWRAITEPAEIAEWMRSRADVDLRVGGKWHLRHHASEDTGPWLPGVIVRLEPERRLAYCWDLSVIEWIIEPTNSGCNYTFVHQGNPFPPEDSSWSAEGVAAGWHEGLVALDGHLDGQSPTDGPSEHLGPRYRELLKAAVVMT